MRVGRSLLLGIVMIWTASADVEAQQHATYRIPEHVFAGSPRGPYRTGTVEELWIDEARDEPTTAEPTDKSSEPKPALRELIDISNARFWQLLKKPKRIGTTCAWRAHTIFISRIARCSKRPSRACCTRGWRTT